MRKEKWLEIKKIFGNRRNYFRYMSKHKFNAFLYYIDRYGRIPRWSPFGLRHELARKLFINIKKENNGRPN